MSYTRRIVSFDRKGRKHVTFQSMGDDSVNCEDEATWRSDPTCQELHPGLYPTVPTAGASNAASTAPTPTATVTQSGSFLDVVGQAIQSAKDAAAKATASSSGGGTTILGLSLPVAAVGAVAAYYLLAHKKRRK